MKTTTQETKQYAAKMTTNVKEVYRKESPVQGKSSQESLRDAAGLWEYRKGLTRQERGTILQKNSRELAMRTQHR